MRFSLVRCCLILAVICGWASVILAQPPFGGPPFPGPDGPPDPILAALDTDGDGEISTKELAAAEESLHKLDSNQDGTLEVAELMPAGPGFGGPGGRGGFRGPFGGPGGPGGSERKIVDQFDRDDSGHLDAEERKTARAEMPQDGGRGPGGRGGPGRFGGDGEPPEPGPTVTPSEVAQFPNAPLYQPTVLRTLFLQFENDDWEEELAAFKNTDVEVPATLVVDGQTFREVGVHFRGMSSYFMIPSGYKRSLNVSLDFRHDDQQLYGHKTLNLLNANGDPSMLSSLLYSHIARRHIPAPEANFVQVVINGESWGVYVSVEQFNKNFVEKYYGADEGARWKVSGSPGGDGGLTYLGEDVEPYRERYEIKSKDKSESWDALIQLCRVLDETPTEQLEAKLRPLLNVDEALWFLALDVALVNSDGYWTRASDYNIYRDPSGQFHVLPHDMNEAFHGEGGPGGPGGFGGPRGRDRGRRGGFGRADQADESPREEARDVAQNDGFRSNFGGAPGPDGGPGGFGPPDFGPGGFGPPGFGPPGGRRGRGGPGGFGEGGTDLDPLVNTDNSRMPLRSKLLAVPALREQYLRNLRTIAQEDLLWQTLGPLIALYREMLAGPLERDTRKLSTLEAFLAATADQAIDSDSQDEGAAELPQGQRGGNRERGSSLRSFMEARRKFLLSYPAIADLPDEGPTAASGQEPGELTAGSSAEGSVSSAPGAAAAELTQPQPKREHGRTIAITELMAANSRTIADAQDEFEDWIELYNYGPQSIELAGFALSDDGSKLDKWKFPEGSMIGPGEYLVVWADEDGKDLGGWHTNFKLSKAGEEVYLVRLSEAGPTIVDSVQFGPQAEDVAFGRFPDHRGSWQIVHPTPGAPNRLGE